MRRCLGWVRRKSAHVRWDVRGSRSLLGRRAVQRDARTFYTARTCRPHDTRVPYPCIHTLSRPNPHARLRTHTHALPITTTHLKVVRVLPDVNAKERHEPRRHARVLVRGRRDGHAALGLVVPEPPPPAALHGRRLRVELGLEILCREREREREKARERERRREKEREAESEAGRVAAADSQTTKVRQQTPALCPAHARAHTTLLHSSLPPSLPPSHARRTSRTRHRSGSPGRPPGRRHHPARAGPGWTRRCYG